MKDPTVLHPDQFPRTFRKFYKAGPNQHYGVTRTIWGTELYDVLITVSFEGIRIEYFRPIQKVSLHPISKKGFKEARKEIRKQLWKESHNS